MKRILRATGVGLLLFLGFGGIYGGWMLVTDPSGGKFEWSLNLLEGTPFEDYLIPGIILMVFIGLLPIGITAATILKKKYTHWFIILQGVILLVWLTAELLFNPAFFVPAMHYSSYAVAALLIFIGIMLLRTEREG